MNSDKDLVGPINLGNPNEFTIIDLAETVLDMIGSKSKLKFEPLPQDDPKQRQPDIRQATESLGWGPKVPLREGLRHAIAYFDLLLLEQGEKFESARIETLPHKPIGLKTVSNGKERIALREHT